jgi:cobalt-zinc-cadmium efflux system outer membrane protein
MIDETPREASYTISRAAIKLTAAAVFFTLLISSYPSQRTAHAATSGQSVQETAPQSERPAAQSDHTLHQTPAAPATQIAPAGPVMTLADIERLAMQNNPTLAQAESAIRAAQGRRRQAGLWPNPIGGYQGEEFAFRAFSQKSEHFAFIEQTIPLGGKLSKSQRIFEREIAQAEIEASAQKQRVLNTVRMLYYEVLGAQQLVDLRTELAKIARDATKTTSELLNVGQADRPDYLESEIETQQVELDLESAKNNLRQVQQSLAAVVGTPGMEPARLAGTLEQGIPTLNQEALAATLMRESPEIKRARAEVERSQAVLARAKAERVPDLFLRGGIGYSTEFLESRTGPTGVRTGPELNVQVGITLPIFNRNQGGIAAAQAEIVIAERELTRTELALRVRLALAFRDYNNAVDAVRRYRDVIVPRAERAYNLYLGSFRQMAASYPQVLISQRTMFQVREHYLNALVDLRQSAIQIEGFLLTGGLDAPRMRTAEAERLDIKGASSKAASNQFEDRER